MKHFILPLFFLLFSTSSYSVDTLSGIEKLSWEAILCLSTGGPPHECDPALNYFYDLKAKKWKDTYKKRKNFLDICPSSGDMGDLTSVLASGAGRCDRTYLLGQLNPQYDMDSGDMINGKGMPSYCTKYYGHALTRLDALPTQINPVGFCFDSVSCSDVPYWMKSKVTSFGGRCYSLIKKPGFMDDLGRGVECLNLWK
ncbi:MAG: hypothetical protein KZQ57_09845 [gamma proteobacterium symbiont of Lucinoma myriamae]|nr:hypothetical protein [gamma proteobacterium symbiont of Lucinoma myriamae]